jgi:hypothetical protein
LALELAVTALPLGPGALAGTVIETIPHSATYCEQLPPGLRAVARRFRGATCGEYLVKCSRIDDASYYTLYVEPHAAAGTILSVSAGRGDKFHYENVQDYVDAGFLTIAVASKLTGPNDAALCAKHGCPPFTNVNDPGPKEAACRVASIIRFLHSTLPNPTCAQAHSAGSSQIAYALAHYGVASIMPYVQLTAWTPFARPDYGCAKNQGDFTSYSGTNPDGTLQQVDDRPYAYRDTRGFAVPLAEDLYGLHAGACAGRPTSLEMRRLREEGIVSTGAAYSYPNTVIDAFACLSSQSMTDGNGSWWWNNVRDADSGRAFMQGLPPGPKLSCTGEEVWWKQNGEPSPIRQLTIDRMVENCH